MHSPVRPIVFLCLNEYEEAMNVLFEAEKFLLTLEHDDFLYVTGLIRFILKW